MGYLLPESNKRVLDDSAELAIQRHSKMHTEGEQ